MIAILSSLIAKDFEQKTGIKSIGLPPFEKLDPPVSTHADMLLSVINNNIFVFSEYFDLNRELFRNIPKDYNIKKIEKGCQSKYPNDIALNVLIIDKKVFCNVKHTAKEIVDYVIKSGYELINISQGYSACSTLVIGKNAAITSDIGVYKELLKRKIDALLISNEGIRLNGYNCGFIGGSSGCNDKVVYFFGQIEKHRDFVKIKEHLYKYGHTYSSVFFNELSDYGGIKFFF